VNNESQKIDWSLTTFDGVRREQLRRARSMTIPQRLEALEQLSHMAVYISAIPLRRPDGSMVKKAGKI
jgi:hypothetical protein